MRASLNQRFENALQHRFGPLQYFIIPKPHHAKSRTREIERAVEIFRHPLRMLATIELDHQSRTHAHEIHDVTAYRHLPTESVATQMAVAHESPETPFGIAWIGAQRTCVQE